MDKSTTSNKMINLETENKSVVRFNVAIHGFSKGQEVRYHSVSNTKKTLIRRRLFDNDGSVEIVEKAPVIQPRAETKILGNREVPNNKHTSKPNNGKQGSTKSNEEDN